MRIIPCVGRRRIWIGVLSVFAIASSLLLWSRTSGFRCTVLRCLAFAYGIWDPLTHEAILDMGPSLITSEYSDVDRLERWFPAYKFEVSLSGYLPCSNGVVFQHEFTGSSQVEQFRHEAASILPDPANVFMLSSKVRGLTRHEAWKGSELNESNPLDLLRAARQGSPLTCRPFSLVFGSCAVVQGYTSRLIGLSLDGTHFDHAVSEVYVPEFGKWIVIDPDFNVAYRRYGQWQNAGELHDIFQEIKSSSNAVASRTALRGHIRNSQLELVVLGEEGHDLRHSNLYGTMDGIGLRLYNNVIYSTRNNYLSASYPKGHPKRTFQYAIVPQNHGSTLAVCPEASIVKDRSIVYFPVGQTEIQIARKHSDDTIEIQLGTWTPNFKAFEIRVDDAGWKTQGHLPIVVPISDGKHVVVARSVNMAGLRGESSQLEIVVAKRNRPATISTAVD